MHGHQQMFASPLCVEAFAILEGLRLAERMEIPEIHLCSDSLRLISMLNGSANREVEVLSTMWDIDNIITCFQRVRFTFVHRQQNGIAHTLACLSLNSPPTIWKSLWPTWLEQLIYSEKSFFVPQRGFA